VKFVAVTELPDLPEPTVDLVFPEPTALRVLRALTASQALMELLVNAVRPEQRVPKALLVLRGLKALKVDPRTGNVSGKLSKEKRRKHMKPSTMDQIKGSLHEMKGKAKEKAGQVTNNPNLAAEGQDEKLAGKVQKKVGQIEKVFEK
jgi:uncharacterized protein YjbJ (UPF0337 family)